MTLIINDQTNLALELWFQSALIWYSLNTNYFGLWSDFYQYYLDDIRIVLRWLLSSLLHNTISIFSAWPSCPFLTKLIHNWCSAQNQQWANSSGFHFAQYKAQGYWHFSWYCAMIYCNHCILVVKLVWACLSTHTLSKVSFLKVSKSKLSPKVSMIQVIISEKIWKWHFWKCHSWKYQNRKCKSRYRQIDILYVLLAWFIGTYKENLFYCCLC